MDIVKFVSLLKEKVKEAANIAVQQASGETPLDFLIHYPVYVCEYTNQRMSPVTRIEIGEGKIIIYGESDGWFADTRWSPEDIIAHADTKGKIMTEEEAIAFLEENGKYIVDDMVARGWDSIDTLLDVSNLPDRPKEDEDEGTLHLQ